MGRIADRFINNDLYQMFLMDLSLYLYAGLTGFIYIFLRRNGYEFTWYTTFYFWIIALGIFVAFWVQSKRLRGQLKFFRFNQGQLLMIVVNVGLFVGLFAWANRRGIPTVNFYEEVLIAGWEQMLFSIIVPVLLLWAMRATRISEKLEVPVFIVAIALSSLGFAFAHWWVYQGSMNTILYLFGVGLVLMTVGYTISPSLGWGLHLFNNVVLITKVM